MNIEYSRQAVKAINRLDRPTKHRIQAGIEKLPEGDVKPLQGEDGHYRLRIGGWRIVYTCPDVNTFRIERVAPRGDVYKGV